MHNREFVRKLQNAHADHIENQYGQLATLPGNPFEIEILRVGSARVFLCNEDRLENRGILTGNETVEELVAISDVFRKKGVEGYFELNPANYYRTEPFSWKSETIQSMLRLGYHPGMFRCVWFLDNSQGVQMLDCDSPRVDRFSSSQRTEFADLKQIVQPGPPDSVEKERELTEHGFTEHWHNYIGFDGNRPVSTSSMFVHKEIGYLSWAFTQPSFRRKGHHKQHVTRRVFDAFELGCSEVFSVTDFNIPSSLSLQELGFRLAYNYLLMEFPTVSS